MIRILVTYRFMSFAFYLFENNLIFALQLSFFKPTIFNYCDIKIFKFKRSYKNWKGYIVKSR